MSPRQKQLSNIRKGISKEKRISVYRLDRYQCVYCGVKPGFLTLDHLKPIKLLYGLKRKVEINSVPNLVTACLACNNKLGDALSLHKNPRFGRFQFSRKREVWPRLNNPVIRQTQERTVSK